MGSFSIWHILIALAVVLLLFGGKGKISGIMGDFGRGITAFKKGLKTEKDEGEAAAAEIETAGKAKSGETIERS